MAIKLSVAYADTMKDGFIGKKIIDMGSCPSCGAPIKGDECEYCGRRFVEPKRNYFQEGFDEGMKKEILKPKVLCVLPGGIPLIDERGLFDSDDRYED